MFFRDLQKTLIPLLSITLVLLFSGCEDDNPAEPESNPGEVLITQANIINFQLQGQTTPIRSKLNTFWGSSYTPDPEIADSLLEKLVENTNLIWSAGLLDHDGTVVNVFPSSEDSLLGRSWANIPEVVEVLEAPNLLTGQANLNGINNLSFNYYRSVEGTDQPYGALYCAIDAELLIELASGLTEFNEENQRGMFILERSSRIIYDRSETYFGGLLNDSQVFSSETVSLANKIVDPSEANGHSFYYGTDVPGGLTENGRHLIAWSICPMEGNTFWSIALIEPF